jgi:hypothetical protein
MLFLYFLPTCYNNSQSLSEIQIGVHTAIAKFRKTTVFLYKISSLKVPGNHYFLGTMNSIVGKGVR